MAKSDQPTPEQRKPAASFNQVTQEIARRNEEAQKAARIRRTAREKREIAMRRQWEQL